MVLPFLSLFHFKQCTIAKKLEDQLILIFVVLPIALFGLFCIISSSVLVLVCAAQFSFQPLKIVLVMMKRMLLKQSRIGAIARII